MKDVKLFWQKYKLFPYEKVLGRREAEALLQPETIEEGKGFLLAKNCRQTDNIEDLVYFSSYMVDGQVFETLQAKREHNKGVKQNTRYLAHGIHEYKGKFNPQIVRAIMNICKCNRQVTVLDPFCGSGTSLLEAELQGSLAYGVDVNPMAAFIARVKTNTIFNVREIQDFDIDAFICHAQQLSKQLTLSADERTAYLRSWFLSEHLQCIEAWKIATESIKNETLRGLLQLSVSNILREYSEQEPSDLRIRRRNSPYPEEPVWEAIRRNFIKSVGKIEMFQQNAAIAPIHRAVIIHNNIKAIAPNELPQFDLAITSPPYATALPYIDTQRLSIVWLGLDSPQNIKSLECSLIGSRETISKRERDKYISEMKQNSQNLSTPVFDFCINLQNALTPQDGFRKQHTPFLLYKYFAEMSCMFKAIHSVMKPGAYYCLVVGYNRTSIGNNTTIDTPSLLAEEAKAKGFQLKEIIPLETYQRYGIHAKRAITGEALIILKA